MVKSVAVDWDGTLVEPAYPAHGDWKPGALEFLHTMRECGVEVVIWTARVNTIYQDGTTKPEDVRAQDTMAIRQRLIDVGFGDLRIHLHEKPNVDLFIDDRAIWFPGSSRAWRAMVVRVLARLGVLDPL